MGNQFLDDLRQADVLIHVVDISGSIDEKGNSVQPLSYDPINDVNFLEEELNQWVFGIIKKGWDKSLKKMQVEKTAIKTIAANLSGLGIKEDEVEQVMNKLKLNPEQIDKWTEQDLLNLAKAVREKSKPIIIAANKMDIQGSEKNLERLKKEFPNLTVIPCSAESELALKRAAKAGLIEYIPGKNDFKVLKELNSSQKAALEKIKTEILTKYGSSGIQTALNIAIFDFLKYIAVFPGGVNKLVDQYGRVLPDCFLIKPNSTALDFAAAIHSDLAKNFIRAIDVKTRMVVGKDHKLKNRDVIEIVTSK